MSLNDLHNILFNAHILYSVALGIWAAVIAANSQSISGNYWGAVVSSALLALVVTILGIIMTFQGLQPGRIVTYYLYMSWLVIMVPGLFTLLRGRDDRSAAIAFSVLAFFNAATSMSMIQRGLVGPWLPPV